jgi:small-conductance mechanosensitive channel
MLHRFTRFALLLTIAAMTISSSIQAARYRAGASRAQQSEKTTNLPSAVQTLQYLKQTIDWHQEFHETEQLANSATEAQYLNDEHQLSKEILQLAFDFAKANAKLLARQAAPPPTDDSAQAGGFSALAKQAADAEKEAKDTQTELDETRRKLATAEGASRTKLQSTVDELTAEVNLAKTRSDTFKTMLQFMQTSGSSGTNLPAQIAELERSVPELAAMPAAAPLAVAPGASRPPEPSGILQLVTSLFSLSGKMRSLDRVIQGTDTLANSTQSLRNPIEQNLGVTAQQGAELAKAADTAGPAELEDQKRQLDALTAHFKDISSVVVPLGQQYVLLGIYKSTLNRWKTAVQNDYSSELEKLLFRGILLAVALGIVFVLGEIWRKATLRYIKDIRRRYQFLLIRRIVLWLAIAITIAFSLATEIGSLATFAGLITAGIAVALQNVILAVAGYFFLVGKYGVRVGDRVQISGVTGNVVDIGLIRLHMMELAGTGNERQPTGRVVVFSNSIVFQPTASFFKQIPGTDFGWHEVSLTLAADSDYQVAEERVLGAVRAVYSTYSTHIEEQHRHMEKTFTLALDVPQPKSLLRLTQTGLEVVVRYPLELERSAEVDDKIIRELLTALERPPKLRLVGSGIPNIQPVSGEELATKT